MGNFGRYKKYAEISEVLNFLSGEFLGTIQFVTELQIFPNFQGISQICFQISVSKDDSQSPITTTAL